MSIFTTIAISLCAVGIIFTASYVEKIYNLLKSEKSDKKSDDDVD